jgi:hypothetical protein
MTDRHTLAEISDILQQVIKPAFSSEAEALVAALEAAP